MPEQIMLLFAKIVKRLRPPFPLVLVGIALFLLFGLYQTLLHSGLLSQVNQEHSAGLLNTLLYHGLIIIVLILLLSFAYSFFKREEPPKNPVTRRKKSEKSE
ncbi:MAG: hypothetical protein PHP00_10895 [Thiotrichaceae bacterium]|nr:hypothetical protein [Thiotrichaceae bacterium]